MHMNSSTERPTPLIRAIAIYRSRQFLAYVMCGSVAALSQLGVRFIINSVMPYVGAIIVSYGAGLIVALLLYRRFVFIQGGGSIRRQAVLLTTSYIVLFPLSFGASLGAALLLSFVLPTGEARLLGHVVGVGLPVFVNFAFNKFVTFRVPQTAQA